LKSATNDDGSDFGAANQNAAWAAKADAAARAEAEWNASILGRVTNMVSGWLAHRSNTDPQPDYPTGQAPGGYVSGDRERGYGGWSW